MKKFLALLTVLCLLQALWPASRSFSAAQTRVTAYERIVPNVDSIDLIEGIGGKSVDILSNNVTSMIQDATKDIKSKDVTNAFKQFIGSTTISQSTISQSGGSFWAKTFGGSSDEIGSAISQTSDGGFVVASRTDSFGAGGSDLLILKLTSTGSISWAKTFGGSSDESNFFGAGKKIVSTTDGGFVVEGYTNSFGAGSDDLLILKLTSTGSISWAKTFGGSSDDWPNSISQTLDGSIIVSGATYSFGAGSDDLLILKLDSSGNIPGSSCDFLKDITSSLIVNSITLTVSSPNPTVTTPTLSVSSPTLTVTSPTLQTSTICECTPTLIITAESLPDGTFVVPYSQTLQAIGGTGSYTWSITSGNLPSGLSLNSSTGVISGKPTGIGTSNFTVQATSGSQTASKSLSIKINGIEGKTIGLDVSHWQGDITQAGWNTLYSNGYRFVFIKATGGKSVKDDYFKNNITRANLAGLKAGAYHVTIPGLGNTPEEEANYFLNEAREYISPGYLTPVLDIEPTDTYVNWASFANWVHRWMDYVKSQTNVEPILYCTKTYANSLLAADPTIQNYKIWIARYTCDARMGPNYDLSFNWNHWEFWQFYEPKPENCGYNKVDGIGENVDLDIFNGDESELEKYVIKSLPPVLLVHGFQIDYPLVTNDIPFHPDDTWKVIAQKLSGQKGDPQQISYDDLGSQHTIWFYSGIDSAHCNVYISNYTGNTNISTTASISTYAWNLSREINFIKNTEHCLKIDIVAHSMGGLVARRYIESADFPNTGYSYGNDIGTLIMIGTPNHGVLEAFLASIFGNLSDYECGKEMIPDSNFLATLNGGVTGSSNGVDYYTFAGIVPVAGIPSVLLPYKNMDGLVEASSVKLDEALNYTVEFADHSGLVQSPEVADAVSGILSGTCPGPMTIHTKYKWSGGLNYLLKSFIVSLFCPVNVTIRDQYGNIINSQGVNQISGASLQVIGDEKYFCLPANLQYTIEINGLSDGNFDLYFSYFYGNGAIPTTVFENVPVSSNTIIHSSPIQPESVAFALNIDTNGDGTIDSTKNPDITGEILRNPTPPSDLTAILNQASVTLSWSPSTQGTYPIAGYAIYRGTSQGNESPSPIATVGSNTTTYTDTDVISGITYYYYVKAFDNQNPPNYSQASNEVSANTKPALFTGVNSITLTQYPGPLTSTNSSAVLIILGDNDTTPSGAIVGIASKYGNGRVIALGHDGFLEDSNIIILDNEKFTTNAITWLDKNVKKKTLISVGHSEWLNSSNTAILSSLLTNMGFSVNYYSGTFSSSTLNDVGLVIIGAAWSDFTNNEIENLKNYVQNGNGLFLLGVGWSWVPYHPGTTIDDYPMNKLGREFGIKWIEGTVSDPTDMYLGTIPIFHIFQEPQFEITSFALYIPSGWSLVSVPFDTDASLLSCQYILYWDGTMWRNATTLHPGIGYLVLNSSTSKGVTITGTPPSSPFTEPSTGSWQLIGNPFTSPATLSSTSTIQFILYWDGTMWQSANVNNLQPGVGYLVLTSSPGTFTFTAKP